MPAFEPVTHCRRCGIEPPPGQDRLFQADTVDPGGRASHDGAALIASPPSGWISIVTTSRCGRAGFWRERSAAVFGSRKGVGPLVVMPDTCILIEVREYLDRLDDETGMLVAPDWSSLGDRIDAVQDLVQLWWARDVRLAVSPQHLADGKLTEPRRLAREAAVRELGRDYWERGGLETFLREEEALAVVDRPCARHAVPRPDLRSDSAIAQRWLWPKHARDRRLAEAAYDAGCHVFLTSEKGILKWCHESLFARGMAVLSPTQLIDALAQSGEFEPAFGRHSPAPDLTTLSVLHAGFPET